jgi:hypothetical protein
MAYKSLVDQPSDFEKFSASVHPVHNLARSNTNATKHASTVHPEENDVFGIGNLESDVEEEAGDWHDEPDITECQPT